MSRRQQCQNIVQEQAHTEEICQELALFGEQLG